MPTLKDNPATLSDKKLPVVNFYTVQDLIDISIAAEKKKLARRAVPRSSRATQAAKARPIPNRIVR